MVSNFIVEGHGYVRDDKGEARLYLETQHDGYFNNEMFIKQVDSALDVFKCKFPHVTAIFLFDNAPCHRKYLPNGLNAASMNVYPRGQTTSNEGYSLEWRDTTYGTSVSCRLSTIIHTYLRIFTTECPTNTIVAPISSLEHSLSFEHL